MNPDTGERVSFIFMQIQLFELQFTPGSGKGFTLAELLIGLAILAILGTISIPVYNNYRDRMNNSQAIADLHKISAVIQSYFLKNSGYPETLDDVHMGHLKDPWGQSYAYLNIATADATKPRQDRSLKPINSDYDLYSKGKDGETQKNIGARASIDDIIRANNGGYIGLAEAY